MILSIQQQCVDGFLHLSIYAALATLTAFFARTKMLAIDQAILMFFKTDFLILNFL